eukprot:gene6695-3363_t
MPLPHAHAADGVWNDFSTVEAEAAINAFRRWHASFSLLDKRQPDCRGPSVQDPYIRLVLDRILPKELEEQLLSQPLDTLLQNVVACRTVVIDEHVLGWAKNDGVRQVLILNSGFDTRAWRIRWPKGTSVFEVDSAMVSAQKMQALGDLSPNCTRHVAIGDVHNPESMFDRLKTIGFDSSKPTIVIIEDVMEHLLPSASPDLFLALAGACAAGSHMVVTLSSPKLRVLLRHYTTEVSEDYEPPGELAHGLIN